MRYSKTTISLLAFLCGVFAAQPALASFHFMQIEQVIGGVNGDTSAQAIQLRMRSSFQQFVAGARMHRWIATTVSLARMMRA